MGSKEKFYRLTTKRAVHKTTGVTLPHVASRHVDYGDVPLIHPDGNPFAQGSLFPPNVTAGVVTKIERQVQQEYDRFRRGHQSRITRFQSAGGAERVTLNLRTHGVTRLGAFIRGGVVATVFPEKSKSKNFLTVKGNKVRRS